MDEKKSEKKSKGKKKTGLGIAIWILLFLIILIVFLVKQEEIKENFEKSGASALIEKKLGKDIFERKKDESKSDETIVIDVTKKVTKAEPLQKSEPVKKSEEKKKSETTQKNEDSKQVAPLEKVEERNPVKPAAEKSSDKVVDKSAEKKSEPLPEKKYVAEEKSLPEQKSPAKEQSAQSKRQEAVSKAEEKTQKSQRKSEPEKVAKIEEKKSAPPVETTLKKKICFVAIDSDGPIVRKTVTRSVSKESPMGDALNFLLAGPSSTEEKTGCRSLIPQGSRLLGASVKNGVATLNFSDEFQFNQFGSEGSLAQLMQVVYTATEFSTVKSVQILIEGQKRDYLTEGVWIGSPLARNSF